MSVPKVPKPDQAATSACAKNKEGPKPGEHVQLFRMKRDRNKGLYSEKCELEASIALYFEWVGYLVRRDVIPPFHSIVARTERHVQRTLPFGPSFLRTKLFAGHRWGGCRICPSLSLGPWGQGADERGLGRGGVRPHASPDSPSPRTFKEGVNVPLA